MQATEDIVEPAAGEGGETRTVGDRAILSAPDQDLVTLRKMLLAPEQAVLKKILHRLDDPGTRAQETAASLPAALAILSMDERALAETLLPLIRQSLAEALRERPDLLARACRHAIGASWRHPFGSFARLLSRMFQRRQRSGQRADLIERLYLVRLDGYEVIETAALGRPPEESPLDPKKDEQERSVVSLASLLLNCLRDPERAARYAALRYLRVDDRVFGVHLNDTHLLLSVIQSVPGALPDAELRECDEILVSASKPEATPPLLPALSSVCEMD